MSMSLMFQSTRPRGARRSHQWIQCDCRLFQSTRPRGARLLWREVIENDGMFQSTRPRGARLAMITGFPFSAYGFNPRARGGRDCIANIY